MLSMARRFEGSLGHLLTSPGFLIQCTLIIASPAALACNRRHDVSANSGVDSRCFDIRSSSMLISADDSTLNRRTIASSAFLALSAFHSELHHSELHDPEQADPNTLLNISYDVARTHRTTFTLHICSAKPVNRYRVFLFAANGTR